MRSHSAESRSARKPIPAAATTTPDRLDKRLTAGRNQSAGLTAGRLHRRLRRPGPPACSSPRQTPDATLDATRDVHLLTGLPASVSLLFRPVRTSDGVTAAGRQRQEILIGSRRTADDPIPEVHSTRAEVKGSSEVRRCRQTAAAGQRRRGPPALRSMTSRPGRGTKPSTLTRSDHGNCFGHSDCSDRDQDTQRTGVRLLTRLDSIGATPLDQLPVADPASQRAEP